MDSEIRVFNAFDQYMYLHLLYNQDCLDCGDEKFPLGTKIKVERPPVATWFCSYIIHYHMYTPLMQNCKTLMKSYGRVHAQLKLQIFRLTLFSIMFYVLRNTCTIKQHYNQHIYSYLKLMCLSRDEFQSQGLKDYRLHKMSPHIYLAGQLPQSCIDYLQAAKISHLQDSCNP